jgi:putative flippase GtrA
MVKKLGKKTYTYINERENLRQFTIYFFVGGFSAFSDLVLLFIFVDVFHIFYLIAATLSFTIVSTVAFFLHKQYTFQHKSKQNKLRYFVFIVVAVSGLLWSLFFLYLFVSILNMYYLFAAVIVKFIVLGWNFLMNKFVTFRKSTYNL